MTNLKRRASAFWDRYDVFIGWALLLCFPAILPILMLLGFVVTIADYRDRGAAAFNVDGIRHVP